MLILLSSGKRKRYRDDILRCLAAPMGSRVQFRYSKRIVENAIWENPKKFTGHQGLVCSVNLSEVGKPCPLVTVRRVLVKSLFKTGMVMTVVLEIGELALTRDGEQLTREIDQKSGGKVPRNKERHSHAEADGSGFFFFTVEGEIGFVGETTVENWQAITATLLGQEGYGEEPFFWTVLGLDPESSGAAQIALDTDRFGQWSPDIRPNETYTLLVHTYHPALDAANPGLSYLRLSSYPEITTSYPLDVVVDSPYDVKQWQFRIKPPITYGASRGWLCIGPVSRTTTAPPHDAPLDWEINLPLRIGFSWLLFAATSVLVGVLVAAPGIIGISLQNIAPTSKLVASILAAVAGIAAAAVVGLGIKRAV